MWKTGHSFIKQKMKEIGAPLAGEMSGHMFFGGDWYGFDDALFAAARLLAYQAREGGPLSRLLADLPKTYATPELRVDCPDEQKFDLVRRRRRSSPPSTPCRRSTACASLSRTGGDCCAPRIRSPCWSCDSKRRARRRADAYRAEVEGWLAARGVTA